MAQQTINIGTVANDGTGDPLRTAFDKVNDNFTELYADDAGDVNSVNGQTGTVVLDSDDISEGATNKYLLSDSVTYAKLGTEYTTVALIAPSSPLNLTLNSAQIFKIDSNEAVDIDFIGEQIGDVKDIIITCTGSSSSLTFNTTTNTVTTIAGEYDATSGAVNFIQVVCTDANTFFVTISQSI